MSDVLYYTPAFGEDLGIGYVDPTSGFVYYTGPWDPTNYTDPSPGIGDSPYAFPGDLTAYENAWGETTYNPIAGIGSLFQDAGIPDSFMGMVQIPGNGTFYDDPNLSWEQFTNNINYLTPGLDTYTDYTDLIGDSFTYYNMGVDTYEQFDSSNAYLSDDIYFDSVMGYADSVADWGSGF